MTIKVSGLKEVEKQLQALGSKDGTRVLRAAMMRAAKPIEDQAKANAAAIPNGSGALEKSIGRRFVIGTQQVGLILLPSLGGRFSVLIAPMKSNRVAVALYNMFYGRKRRGIYHGHFVEFGHRIGTSVTGALTRSRRGGRFAKRSQGSGNVPARPFLRPALQARSQQAIEILADELRKGIDRMVKRQAKK